MDLNTKAALEAATKGFRAKKKPVVLKEGGPFAMGSHRIHQEAKAKERARFKGFVHAGNVGSVLPSIPWEAWGVTHFLLKGDFVLADLIPAILKETKGFCPHLRIASLGYSKDNIALFSKLLDSGKVGKLSLLSSSYFAATDRVEAFGKMRADLLKRGAMLGNTRSHAKLICLPIEGGPCFAMHGSANARTSRNAENLCVENNRDLHDFFAEYLDDMIAANPVTE